MPFVFLTLFGLAGVAVAAFYKPGVAQAPAPANPTPAANMGVTGTPVSSPANPPPASNTGVTETTLDAAGTANAKGSKTKPPKKHKGK
jgi:hypothetical protein